MNAEVSDVAAGAHAARLKSALASQCGLSDDALAEIDRVQEDMGLDFAEAAVHLNYARREDLDQAQARLNQSRAVARRLPDAGALVRKRPGPVDLHAENLRALRTELMLRHRANSGANVIAVLSPCGGEGRSQLAAELAGSFAQLNQPTLLVDADLRHPSLHLLYGLDNDKGLANAVLDDRPAQFHPVGPGDLSLLTAGHGATDPVELLSSSTFEKMLGGWSNRFDHIIFDSPPAALYPDALALATVVGRILSVSRAQQTSMKATREMLRRLEATRAELLGAVIAHF